MQYQQIIGDSEYIANVLYLRARKQQTVSLISVIVVIPERQLNDAEEKQHMCFSNEPIKCIKKKAWATPQTHCFYTPN